MLAIRLQRTGKRNDPSFRIVVCEKSTSVRGKSLEVVGHYLPTRNPASFDCNRDRILYWMSKGAQPSDTLARLLKRENVEGMDAFIQTYTKKRKRKEVDEPAPTPVPAAAPPPAEQQEAPAAEEAAAAPVEENKEAPSHTEETDAQKPVEEEVEAAHPAEEPTEDVAASEEEVKN